MTPNGHLTETPSGSVVLRRDCTGQTALDDRPFAGRRSVPLSEPRRAKIRDIIFTARSLLPNLPTMSPTACDARGALELLEDLRQMIIREVQHPKRSPNTNNAAFALLIDRIWTTRDEICSLVPGRIDAMDEIWDPLSQAASVDELLDETGPALTALGFPRVGISFVDSNRWVIQRAYIADSPSLSARVLDISQHHPQDLKPDSFEAQVANGGKGILFGDVGHHLERTHGAIAQTLNVTSVLVVPLLITGRSAGLIHVDFSFIPRHRTADQIRNFVDFSRVYNLLFETVFLRDSVHQFEESLRAGPLKPVSTRKVATPNPGHYQQLTPRENEVMEHMSRGLTNEQIAGAMFLSSGTVKSHVKHILKKLGVDNRATAIAQYLRAGS